jgi:putative spermidine/putrescine transport system substrate-binding protein
MDQLSKGACAQYSANKTEGYYRSIKFWKTPITDCGNGQSNCMDLRAWTDAWTKIKG